MSMPRNLRISPRTVILYSDFNAIILLDGGTNAFTAGVSSYSSTRAPFAMYKFGPAEDWLSPNERKKAFIVWLKSI